MARVVTAKGAVRMVDSMAQNPGFSGSLLPCLLKSPMPKSYSLQPGNA